MVIDAVIYVVYLVGLRPGRIADPCDTVIPVSLQPPHSKSVVLGQISSPDRPVYTDIKSVNLSVVYRCINRLFIDAFD